MQPSAAQHLQISTAQAYVLGTRPCHQARLHNRRNIVNLKRFHVCRAAVVSILLTVIARPVAAQNRNDLSIPRADVVRVESGAWLQASVPGNKPWNRVSRGSILESRFALPVYSGEEVAIPAGTKLRLKIDMVAKVNDRGGIWKKLGRGILRAFNPLNSRPASEYTVDLSGAEAILPDGSLLPLKTHVLRAANGIMVLPETRRRGKEDQSQVFEAAAQRRAKPEQTILLRLDEGIVWPVAETSKVREGERRKTVPAKRARAFLLTALSASQNHEGDLFQAQLAEPVRLGDQVFEAGSLLEGSVFRSRAPRVLSRAGSLRLRVDHVTSPRGQILAVTGTLASAQANAQTRFVLDEEGGLRGLKPGVKNALVDLGISYALGKVADDISETPIRAIGAGMSDATVASVARYLGLGTSALFLVTRRGRDVRLPKYGEIEIDFGRSGKEPF
jgi:hypothetical protein